MVTTNKIAPHDTDSELSVIGSLLIDGDAIRLVENTIKSPDFFNEQAQMIYEACVTLRSRRERINQITAAQELDRQGKLETCGGAAYLSYLITICPTSLDIEYYAQIVRRLSVSRQLIVLGGKVEQVGFSAEPDTNQALETVTTMITELRKTVTVFDELISPKDAAHTLYDMMDEYNNPKHTTPWGFVDLDYITSGIYPELIIFGARPGTGKTQLMLDVLENLAWRNKKILFCSAEMSIRSILERKIARELRVDIRELRRNGLDPDLMGKLSDLAGEVSENQVYYLPQGITSQDIYQEAAKLKEHGGLDIVFVDYLQILKDCWQLGKESKATLVGRASKILKALVNDLQIPVICASQLNRDLERRPEEARKPVLADLRESGDIEQDADVVFLLWRDLTNMDENIRNVLEVKMAKNRQLGDAPAIKLNWLQEQHRYVDAYRDR